MSEFNIKEKVYFNINGITIEDEIVDICTSYPTYRYRTKYSKSIFHGQWFAGYIEHDHGYITKIPTHKIVTDY